MQNVHQRSTVHTRLMAKSSRGLHAGTLRMKTLLILRMVMVMTQMMRCLTLLKMVGLAQFPLISLSLGFEQHAPRHRFQAKNLCANLPPRALNVEQAQSIFYILQHSTLILPVSREGEVLLRLLLKCLMMGENKKCYYYTVESTRYI